MILILSLFKYLTTRAALDGTAPPPPSGSFLIMGDGTSYIVLGNGADKIELP